MGIARLLAKGWVVFCIYAGVLAVAQALALGEPAVPVISGVAICVVLFAAMGLLFTTGYAISGRDPHLPLLTKLRPHHLLPGFNAAVFAAFATLSLIDQLVFAPRHLGGPVVQAVLSAVDFAIPGQHAFLVAAGTCGVNGGSVFAFAFSWLLALVFLGSAASRIRLAAGLVRLERAEHPAVLGPTVTAAVLGVVALAGIQFLVLGTLFNMVGCLTLSGLPGKLIVGLGPLMLAYLILAALTAVLSLGPEH